MYYEINVDLNGSHYFATAEWSIKTQKKAQEVYAFLKKKFPESDGFNVTIMIWKTTGTELELSYDAK